MLFLLSLPSLISSSTSYLSLLLAVITWVYFWFANSRKSKKVLREDGLLEAPTPRRLPIIGHLHLLGGYEVPYQAFSALGLKYGKVINLQLGNVKCVVINGQNNIREALVTKGHHFDSRPSFQRYQQLFSGNKENSLAFCDWSETQKVRRGMLKTHTFPRAFTNKFFSLEDLVLTETDITLSKIKSGDVTDIKPLILHHCANIFFNHFCSKNYDSSNKKFTEIIESFDEIFYEVNQGHAADFLPFLMPFHKKNMERLNSLTHKIREFIEGEVIADRYAVFDIDSEPHDYVENLIKYVKGGESPELPWDTALFALEDVLGGHSAVGNFLVKLFAFIVKEPEVQKRAQKEIDSAVGGSRLVRLSDRNSMPYTEAVIYEVIRLIASPIVPRVANQNSSINGYKIEKGSLLFLNNYDLSMSNELWEEPEKFKPERFLKDGKLVKPEHFLPFGGGRRSCLGYRMVHLIAFGMLGSCLQNFTIAPVEKEAYKVPIGSLALKKDTFKFKFIRR